MTPKHKNNIPVIVSSTDVIREKVSDKRAKMENDENTIINMYVSAR